jgi:hypothetical protein
MKNSPVNRLITTSMSSTTITIFMAQAQLKKELLPHYPVKGATLPICAHPAARGDTEHENQI